MIDGDTGVLELEVISLRRESNCVLAVELADPENRVLPAWEPGAHIDLGLPECVRQYSLAGDPDDRYRYRIAVLLEPESTGGSTYVHTQLRPGELVEVGGPRNHFPLVEAPDYLMIAGGVGITPILPMIRQLDREGRSWKLLYGGRSRKSMAYLDEMGQYGERVDIRPFDEHGHLDLEAALTQCSADTVVYCCGPEGLIAAVEALSASRPSGTLHVERFAAPDRDDEDDLEAFELVLAKSGRRLTVPADCSALDVLDAAGIALPNACRDGVCGSCETRVLSGIPLHRDALADDNCTDLIYPCVSRAQSAELVLDL
jgi:ferredoxin-NADP reductase